MKNMNQTEKETESNETKEIDYSFTGDKEAQDFAYALSDKISEEDWKELTESPNKIIEFVMLLSENLVYLDHAKLVNHLVNLLAEAAEV